MSIQQSVFTGFAAMVLAACAAAPEATAQTEAPARTISVNGEGRVYRAAGYGGLFQLASGRTAPMPPLPYGRIPTP